MKLLPLTVLALSVVLCTVSCSENSTRTSDNASTLSHKLKSVSNAVEFERKYKDALVAYFNTLNSGPYYAEEDTIASPSDGGQNSESDSSSSVSDTNVQETGVDEADRIKTNGKSLFVLTNRDYGVYPVDGGEVASSMPAPDGYYGEPNHIRVYDLEIENADTQLVSEFELSLDPEMNSDGMYLYNYDDTESLIVTSHSSGYYSPYWYEPYSWGGYRSSLSRINVSDTANLKQTGSLEFSGSIISTRRIGKYLIVASRFFPTIDGINYFPQSEKEKSENKVLIESLSINNLMPTYESGGDKSLLTKPENCFVPESADSLGYNPDVISLVSYDLTNMSIADSLCFVGSTETIYASTQGVYLATTRYDWALNEDGTADYMDPDVETDIHAFSFASGGFSYDASGIVKGHLGWNFDRRPFRLSEKNGDLRVVSFTGDLQGGKSPVRFTVLRDNEGELQTLSSLPNDAHPEPLGKPGEQLYGSRFVGDRAFFVTFRATDPLYVLDLSDPTDPFVAGELYIDGYSDYLHPVTDDLMLGLGKDAIPDNSGDSGRGAWFQGVKISLIDISDPGNPKEINKKVLGKRGTESPALWAHHAFTYLPADGSRGNARFSIPISINESPSGYVGDAGKPWEWYGWTKSGLQLFEIDITSKTLIDAGFMEVANRESSDFYGVIGNDRSVLASDSVFFLNNNRVFSSFWQSPEILNGPK